MKHFNHLTEGWQRFFATGTILLTLAGCGIDFAYLLPAGVGQLSILQQMVPVEAALAGGNLTDEQLAKLRLIQDVRAYCSQTIGLTAGDNYTTFYDAHGEPVAYNISASRRDAFKPRIWTFPLVGAVPYLGYFDRPSVEAKKAELEADNLDVFIYTLDAYSGLGFYPNPILSPMLERSNASLVNTVVHELLHATIWRENDTPFNESLATFVGRIGAESYFRDHFPDDPDRVRDAQERFEDSDLYSNFALEMYNDLDAYYATDLPAEAKIAGRVALFNAAQQRFLSEVSPVLNRPDDYAWVREGFPVNNAWLLGVRRYNLELDVFSAVFDASGRNWSTALRVFREAAAADQPYDYLRAWASTPPAAKRAVTSDDIPATTGATPTPDRTCPTCTRRRLRPLPDSTP